MKYQRRTPLLNEYLFACPAKLPTRQITPTLQVSGQPVLELSASHWKEEWRMANDLLKACDAEEFAYYQPGTPVNWDSVEEWLYVKGVKGGQVRGGQLLDKNFIGELFIIRDCSIEVAENISRLVEWVDATTMMLNKKPHLFSQTKLAVVLAGWKEPTLEAKPYGRLRTWIVNPLSNP